VHRLARPRLVLRIVGLAALVCAVAAAAAFALSGSSGPAAGARIAKQGWERLPPLPGHPPPDVADANAIAASGGDVFVATSPRSARDGAYVGSVWRWNGRAWSGPVGGRFKSGDNPSLLLADFGGRPCAGWQSRAGVDVRCLVGDRWERLGGRIWGPASSSEHGGLAALWSTRTRLFALRSRSFSTRHGGAQNRFDLSVYDGRRWRAIGMHGLAPPGTSPLRPFAFTIDGRPCLWFQYADLNGRQPAVLRAACAGAGGWSPILDDIRPADVASDVQLLDTDGAAASGKDVWLGMSVALPPSDGAPTVNWSVGHLHGRELVPTALSRTRPGWVSQGRLDAGPAGPIALAFDQHPTTTSGAPLGVLEVRRLTGTTQSRPLGGTAVLPTQRLRGPIAFQLATGDRRLYTLYAAAHPGERRMELRVAATPLDPPRP
jgi:hypothetical protein